MSWGGKREGAGRPTDKHLAFQHARRDLVSRVVTEKRWRQAILALLAKCYEGDALAFKALAPYVMGAPPKEVTVKVDVEQRIREAAAQAGLEPEDALAEAERILAQTKGTQ